LDEVVGEGVVVIEDEEHLAGNPRFLSGKLKEDVGAHPP